MSSADILKEIKDLREKADQKERDFISSNKKLIIELAEMILLLKKKGRISSPVREFLDKAISGKDKSYRIVVGISDDKVNIFTQFQYYDYECGWLPYFGDYRFMNILIPTSLIDDPRKLVLIFDKKKEEWKTRDEKAKEVEIQKRKEQLEAELANLS